MLILLGIGACLMSHGFCSIDVQVIIPTTVEDDFLLSAEALEEHLTEKTRVLILCTPSNPTGAVYPLERLQEIAAVVSNTNACFVAAPTSSEMESVRSILDI